MMTSWGVLRGVGCRTLPQCRPPWKTSKCPFRCCTSFLTLKVTLKRLQSAGSTLLSPTTILCLLARVKLGTFAWPMLEDSSRVALVDIVRLMLEHTACWKIIGNKCVLNILFLWFTLDTDALAIKKSTQPHGNCTLHKKLIRTKHQKKRGCVSDQSKVPSINCVTLHIP